MTLYEQYLYDEQQARDQALLAAQPLDIAVLAVSTCWMWAAPLASRVLHYGHIRRTFSNDVLPRTEPRQLAMERGS